jgi:hypothetical protein
VALADHTSLRHLPSEPSINIEYVGKHVHSVASETTPFVVKIMEHEIFGDFSRYRAHDTCDLPSFAW